MGPGEATPVFALGAMLSVTERLMFGLDVWLVFNSAMISAIAKTQTNPNVSQSRCQTADCRCFIPLPEC